MIPALCLQAVVGKYMEQFRGCGQQDAHEFLTFLMDWLHNDLMTQKEKVKPEVWLTIACNLFLNYCLHEMVTLVLLIC